MLRQGNHSSQENGNESRCTKELTVVININDLKENNF